MSEQSAKLVHEFTYHTLVGNPHDVGAGPYGHRQFFEMREGEIDGPRLKGRMLGTAGDWMLTGPDGFMRMDVRMQIATDDKAIICAHYFGPAEANQRFTEAMAASKPTTFSDQTIRSHWLLEAGDPRYAWVNQAVFVGEGRLRPAGPGVMGFEHRVYRVG